MPYPPANTSIACPFCRQPITIQVHQIVDVGEQPDLKQQLLAGRLNSFTCPHCHNSGALATPFFYHDADKELALLFIPMNVNAKEADQQKMIGRLTQQVMSNLPPEKRKAYLLQPQQFFNLKTMIETILQADGITPEMLAKEEARLNFLQELIDTMDDAKLDELIKTHDADFDVTLFQLLTSALAAAASDRQKEEFDRVQHLRDRALELTTLGQKIKRQQVVIDAFTANPTRETLLDQLIASEDSEVREALLTMGRPMLDYPFFQALTAKIDAAKKDGKVEEEVRLTGLRKEILAMRDKIDAQAQAVMDDKAALLRELLGTPEADLEKTMKARIDELDDFFFEVLTQNLQRAQQSDPQVFAQLQKVGDAAMRVIQGTQPPEVRFINTLLQIEYPNQTKELLERNKQVLGPEFIGWMEGLAGELRESGRAETAERLVLVIDQAKEIAGLKVSLK
ncbi:MAG TPA: CpXC domain-containing protein [Anaerolineae bacterium]|nr:CpXC domain-containing protein [Anaerolineae bacterium]